MCPWLIDIVIEFADERRAVAFERYLKTGRLPFRQPTVSFVRMEDIGRV